MSVAQLVEAGDAVGFEQLASGLSAAQLILALSPERIVGHMKEASSPLTVAVKRRDLQLIRAIMNWVPEGQVCGESVCVQKTRIMRYGVMISVFAFASGRRGEARRGVVRG